MKVENEEALTVYMEEDVVPMGAECPECGENRVDWLEWLDEERVECTVCGTIYQPS